MNKILILKNGTIIEVIAIKSSDIASLEPEGDISASPIVEAASPIVEDVIQTETDEPIL